MHSVTSKRYYCVRCQKSFSEWKNFRRHGIEVHAKTGWVTCKFCPLKTKRNYDLKIHCNKKHKYSIIVVSLLHDLVSEIILKNNTTIDEVNCSEANIVHDEVVEDVETDTALGDNAVTEFLTAGTPVAYVHEICECEYVKFASEILLSAKPHCRKFF